MKGMRGKIRAIGLLALYCLALPLLFVRGAFAVSATCVPPDAHATIDAALAVLEELKYKEERERLKGESEGYIRSSDEEARRAEGQAEEARATAEEAQRTALLAEAEKDAAWAEARKAMTRAEAVSADARRALDASNAASRRADALNAAARKRDEANQRAQRAYEQAEREREATIEREERALEAGQKEAASKAASGVPDTGAEEQSLDRTDELRRTEGEQEKQEKAQRELDASRKAAEAEAAKGRPVPAATPAPILREADWGAVRQAYARAQALEKAAIEADRRSEKAQRDADAKIAVAEEAEAKAKAEEARGIVADARNAADEYGAYAIQARDEAGQIRLEQERILFDINNPETWRFFSTGAKYFRWDDGRSGYQTVLPIYFGSWKPEFGYSLYTQYVMSDNLDTFTDTTLFLSGSSVREKSSWEYFLSVNIPTGKSDLNWSERYARVTEDLVWVEQFGKGWQLTPGIAYNWRTSSEDVWTIGTSYTYGWSYDPTSDIPNDDISPGGEWAKFLRYQHIEEKWQFVGELINTSYGRTDIDDGTSYRDDDSWEGRLTFNRVLNERDNLMFYYWLARQSQTDVPFETDDPLVHYFGTMWSRKLNDRARLRLTADVMTTDGSRYYSLYSLYSLYSYYDTFMNPRYGAEMVDGRTKYTFGVGYDYDVSERGTLNLDIQYFQMRDGESTLGFPATTYDGFNVYLNYFMNL